MTPEEIKYQIEAIERKDRLDLEDLKAISGLRMELNKLVGVREKGFYQLLAEEISIIQVPNDLTGWKEKKGFSEARKLIALYVARKGVE